MKTLFSLGLLVVLGPVSVQAQIFRPEAVSGAAIGAIAGAIMGNNNSSLGHDGLRGAAWGAGIGLVLGTIAEQNARVRSVPPPVRVIEVPALAAPTPPQQITIINNYYNTPATPMAPANQLFGRN